MVMAKWFSASLHLQIDIADFFGRLVDRQVTEL